MTKSNFGHNFARVCTEEPGRAAALELAFIHGRKSWATPCPDRPDDPEDESGSPPSSAARPSSSAAARSTRWLAQESTAPSWRPSEPRWNPPGSFPTFCLNADLETAKLQIVRMLDGYPGDTDDLEDDAYRLVAATLPRNQTCADAVREAGLRALGLPRSYPLDEGDALVPRTTCQHVRAHVHADELRGVLCRSAMTPDSRGRELAWFPATESLPRQGRLAGAATASAWRDAVGWVDLDLPAPDETLQLSPRVSASLSLTQGQIAYNLSL